MAPFCYYQYERVKILPRANLLSITKQILKSILTLIFYAYILNNIINIEKYLSNVKFHLCQGRYYLSFDRMNRGGRSDGVDKRPRNLQV